MDPWTLYYLQFWASPVCYLVSATLALIYGHVIFATMQRGRKLLLGTLESEPLPSEEYLTLTSWRR